MGYKTRVRLVFFRPHKGVAKRRTEIEVAAAIMTSTRSLSQFIIRQCGMAGCWLGIAHAITMRPAIAGNVPGKDVPGCSRDEIGMMWSPDNSWLALMQEEVCSDGGYVTTIIDYVQLVRRGVKPTRENDVFAIEEHGDAKLRPVLQWLSSTKLQITVPNISTVDFQKSNYRGLDIVVKFDPDDPAVRQQFLENHGLDKK